MLDDPQHPQGVMAVAGQFCHRVDHVFQHLGAGQRTILGDMTDQHGGQRPGLGLSHQSLGRRPDLADRTGRTALGRQVDGLHRIHDEQVGFELIEVGKDRLNGGIAGQPEVVVHGAQPLGPQPNLTRRLLGADQEDPAAGTDPCGGELQGEGRLADARLTAQQRDRAGHQAPAERPINFGHAGGNRGRLVGSQRRQGSDLTDPEARCGEDARATGPDDRNLH